MDPARAVDTHRMDVYLQVRPVASFGALGLDSAAFPDLPEAARH